MSVSFSRLFRSIGFRRRNKRSAGAPQRLLAAEGLEERRLLTDLVRMRVDASDTVLNEGETFDVNVYLQDTRPPTAESGMFSGYLDLVYDPVLFQVVSGTETIHDPPFSTSGQAGDFGYLAGEIQNAGSYTFESFLGSGEYPLFTIPFTVPAFVPDAVNDDAGTHSSFTVAAGSIDNALEVLANDVLPGGPTTIQGEAAEGAFGGFFTAFQQPGSDPDPVPPSRIDYGSVDVTVIPDGSLSILSADANSIEGGTVTVSPDNQRILYTPPAKWDTLPVGENRTDTFEYTVTDGTDTDTASVEVTVLGGNGVWFDMTLVTSSSGTPVGPVTGELAQLPESQTWLDEWGITWVELWVSTPGSEEFGIQEAAVDLSYDPQYFTLEEIRFDGAFGQDGVPVDNNGQITNIRGTTIRDDVGDDGFALLARVGFVSAVNLAPPVFEGLSEYLSPAATVSFTMFNETAKLEGDVVAATDTATHPEVTYWAVGLDINNNNLVDLGDLAGLASVFNDPVTPGLIFTYGTDFNYDGVSDLGDLSIMAANFNHNSADRAPILYPGNFPDDWLPPNLRAASQAVGGAAQQLAAGDLAATVSEAVVRLESATGEQAASAASDVTVEIVDLPDDLLGRADGKTVQIDIDAAGHGWFVDATPADDAEFVLAASGDELAALPGGPAAGKFDLLTTVMHELAHVLGYDDDDGHALMQSVLSPGTRWLPDLSADPSDDSNAEGIAGARQVDVALLDQVFAEV